MSSSRSCTGGETIFAPSTNPHSLYLLESGLARIFRLSEEGSETTFGYVAPGEVFGELSAFGDYPRESFAVAVRPSRVWKIPAETFRPMLAHKPGLVLEITRQIGSRLKRIEARVENLVFRDARSRVAHILLELGQDLGRPDEDGVLIDVELTQSEIATLVGSTRQTVNANLREFEQQGWVARRGRRILVRDEKALRAAASPPPAD